MEALRRRGPGSMQDWLIEESSTEWSDQSKLTAMTWSVWLRTTSNCLKISSKRSVIQRKLTLLSSRPIQSSFRSKWSWEKKSARMLPTQTLTRQMKKANTLVTSTAPKLALSSTPCRQLLANRQKKKKRRDILPVLHLPLSHLLSRLPARPPQICKSRDVLKSSSRLFQSRGSRHTASLLIKKSSWLKTSQAVEVPNIHHKCHRRHSSQSLTKQVRPLTIKHSLWQTKNWCFWWTSITSSSGIESIRNLRFRRRKSYKRWKPTASAWSDQTKHTHTHGCFITIMH